MRLAGWIARWKRLARRLGDAQARALFSVFYFVVLTPFALAVRWLADPLAIKPGAARGWQPRGEEPGTAPERALRQF